MGSRTGADPARRAGWFSSRRVSWREWTALAAGAISVAALFLPWTNLAARNQIAEEALREVPAGEVARDAWTTGFLAWAGPLLLVLTGLAVVLFGQSRRVRMSGLPQLWLMAAAVAVVLMVLGWLAMDSVLWHSIDRAHGEDASVVLQEGGVGAYGGLGRYLGMLGGLASLAVAVLDVRASRRAPAPSPSRRGR
ncbi:hypothetical protein FNH05_16750 [Amycolatopsis rhizosphaerae]|uniref:Uncharacterized protein n=1 Tax=Amycolatopsis rhizosphaerae TaxID=2053003 RepID=A0A558CLK9_9PSEU|nr:hypothetical protein [Amycolatopsis rhizosphaerae]TVT49646.1 hypothetical protein FNH05_16750 [Amycolatopsis rhizosphaerae]